MKRAQKTEAIWVSSTVIFHGRPTRDRGLGKAPFSTYQWPGRTYLVCSRAVNNESLEGSECTHSATLPVVGPFALHALQIILRHGTAVLPNTNTTEGP